MTKSEYVAQELKTSIAGGEWMPGDRILSEAELCSRYGVSRLSVRSAINTLAAQGILTSMRGRGTFVCDSNTEASGASLLTQQSRFSRTDMFEFRRMIETESAALAALRADEANIRELHEVTMALQHAVTPDEGVTADMEFHHSLALATKNEVIAETFNMLSESYRRLFIENVALRGPSGASEHLQIVLAIEGRDPDLARKYMADHLNRSMQQAMAQSYVNTGASSPANS